MKRRDLIRKIEEAGTVCILFMLVCFGHATEPAIKTEGISIAPKVSEKQFTVPAIPKPLSTTRVPVLETNNGNVDAATRLNLAMKEIRRLEIRSLDPKAMIEEQQGKGSGLGSFHDFRTIGRKELRNEVAIQDLLHAVVLAIAAGPEETYECFMPRHGLRIYTRNQVIDVVICYECLNGILYVGEEVIWFSTSKEAEPAFDSVFAKLGLHKAE